MWKPGPKLSTMGRLPHPQRRTIGNGTCNNAKRRRRKWTCLLQAPTHSPLLRATSNAAFRGKSCWRRLSAKGLRNLVVRVISRTFRDLSLVLSASHRGSRGYLAFLSISCSGHMPGCETFRELSSTVRDSTVDEVLYNKYGRTHFSASNPLVHCSCSTADKKVWSKLEGLGLAKQNIVGGRLNPCCSVGPNNEQYTQERCSTPCRLTPRVRGEAQVEQSYKCEEIICHR